MAKKKRIPHKFHPWIDARKRFKLSDAHIQMARELGLSPKRFGRYADRTKEPWKLPLSEFIEAMYQRQFGKERPDEVQTMEEIAAAHVEKRATRKVENLKVKQDAPAEDAPADEEVAEVETAGDEVAECEVAGQEDAATETVATETVATETVASEAGEADSMSDEQPVSE